MGSIESTVIPRFSTADETSITASGGAILSIKDLGVTEGKIAALAVTEGKIGAGAVSIGKLATSAREVGWIGSQTVVQGAEFSFTTVNFVAGELAAGDTVIVDCIFAGAYTSGAAIPYMAVKLNDGAAKTFTIFGISASSDYAGKFVIGNSFQRMYIFQNSTKVHYDGTTAITMTGALAVTVIIGCGAGGAETSTCKSWSMRIAKGV